MRKLHDGQRSARRIDDSIWTSVDRSRKVSKRPEGTFVGDVGNDHASSDGQVRFANLDVPSEDETPPSVTPIPAHLHMCSVWRDPRKFAACSYVVACRKRYALQKRRWVVFMSCKLTIPSEVYFVLPCHREV